MHILKRRTVSLRLLLLVVAISIAVMLHLRHVSEVKHEADRAQAMLTANHIETDLDRREREEKELGRLLLPYMQMLKSKALRPLSQEEMIAHATKGLCAIDPYSKCFSDDEYAREQQSLIQTYKGIGIAIAHEKKGARIIDVYLRSPAENAGLQIGDTVTHVVINTKKQSLAGKSEEEQLALLDGPSGTTLSMLVLRNKKVFASPPIIRVQSIAPTIERVQLLAPHYGLVHIRRFTFDQTASELRYAIDRLKQSGVLRGMVIDLRGNLGGSFSESVDMAGFFLDGGVVTTTFNRTEGRKSYDAPLGDMLHGTPIVLLVDGNSASASELFAGALTDRDIPRAILMGEKTYGKGVGQTTEVGPNGGKVVITSFEFFTPKGHSVHGKGFTPDPLLLETFRDEDALDAWQGAALKYLLSERRTHQARR